MVGWHGPDGRGARRRGGVEEINEPGTEKVARHITSILTRKDDSRLEDEFVYL